MQIHSRRQGVTLLVAVHVLFLIANHIAHLVLGGDQDPERHRVAFLVMAALGVGFLTQAPLLAFWFLFGNRGRVWAATLLMFYLIPFLAPAFFQPNVVETLLQYLRLFVWVVPATGTFALARLRYRLVATEAADEPPPVARPINRLLWTVFGGSLGLALFAVWTADFFIVFMAIVVVGYFVVLPIIANICLWSTLLQRPTLGIIVLAVAVGIVAITNPMFDILLDNPLISSMILVTAGMHGLMMLGTFAWLRRIGFVLTMRTSSQEALPPSQWDEDGWSYSYSSGE